MNKSYKVVDLIDCKDEELIKKWKNSTKKVISKDSHNLKENYTNITKEYKNYISFLIVIDENQDEFVMFEGLWNPGVYPPETARVLCRKYIYPKFRNKNLPSINNINMNLSKTYTMPIFFEKAKALGLKSIFISRERKYKNSFRKLIESLNENQSPWHFELLDGLFNTCRQVNDKGYHIGVNESDLCWQFVAVHNFTPNNFPLPLRK